MSCSQECARVWGLGFRLNVLLSRECKDERPPVKVTAEMAPEEAARALNSSLAPAYLTKNMQHCVCSD
jgi:hypothetical protein